MPRYSMFEKYIIELFNSANKVTWNNKEYYDISAHKPKVQGGGGECKTDIYVVLRSADGEDSIKITVKQTNAEFLANKMKKDDAQAVFGSNWQSIVSKAVNSIENSFTSSTIVYGKPNKNSRELYFTLGWKLEITNKPRKLSSKIKLSRDEIVNKIYRGTAQPDRRRDALVNNVIIKNSGVADFLLEADIDSGLQSAQAILNSLVNLKCYIPPPVYLAFTANNYKLIADNADGKRTLAVAIRWSVSNKKLIPEFVFDQPLEYQGETHMMPLIKQALLELDINSPKTLKDIDIDNLL